MLELAVMPLWAVSCHQELSLALPSPWLLAMEVQHIQVRNSSSNNNNSLPATLLPSSSNNPVRQASSSPVDMVPNNLSTVPLPRLALVASPRAWQTCKWEEPNLSLSSNSRKGVLVL